MGKNRPTIMNELADVLIFVRGLPLAPEKQNGGEKQKMKAKYHKLDF